MQTKKNSNSLWMGTLVAALTLLLTGYLYYNVIRGGATDPNEWLYIIIYALVAGFCLSYLCWKTKRIAGSHLITGIIIGLLVGVFVLAVMRLGYYRTAEEIICCSGMDCWIVAVQSIVASATVAFTGKTGAGSDD